MANRIIRRLASLLDVDLAGVADGDALTYRSSDGKIVPGAGGGGSSTLAGLSDVTGRAGTGKAPVSNGAGGFPLTDVATQAELDVEVAARGAAISGLASVYQPLDSDLTAIAALSTTSFGRSLLALADAAALRTAAGLGTAATAASGDFDAAGAAAAAQAASQPLDSDLTAIAALSTTSFGRSLLALADAAAARTSLSLVPGTDVEAHDADLTTIAGLSAANDDVLQRKSGAWVNRTVAQLLIDLAAPGTTFQPLDSDLTAIAALTTTSFGRALLALADAAAGRTALGLGTLATQSGTFSGTSSGTNTGDQTLNFVLIGDTVLGSDTASFAFTSLAGYKHLKLIVSLRTDRAAVEDLLLVQFNSDTTAGHYYTQRELTTATTVSAAEFLASFAGYSLNCPGASATASMYGPGELNIVDYLGSQLKTCIATAFAPSAVTTGGLDSQRLAMLWNSTAAITRIDLKPGVGTVFKTGSRATLYGLS